MSDFFTQLEEIQNEVLANRELNTVEQLLEFDRENRSNIEKMHKAGQIPDEWLPFFTMTLATLQDQNEQMLLQQQILEDMEIVENADIENAGLLESIDLLERIERIQSYRASLG
ncbi:MAG: hypothetical protein ACRDBG_07075 [Waterburya sp.]